jgi:hypothetical protein
VPLGIQQATLTIMVSAVALPAALYFLLIGVLNSRTTPQLVRGRTDFICLTVAFSPMFALPLLQAVGASAISVVVVLGAIVAATAALAPPRRGNWVIYNTALDDAMASAEQALSEMDRPFRRDGRRLRLTDGDLTVRLSSIPLLRNVSIQLEGPADEGFSGRFEARLADRLGAVPAGATPMASAFLMIATALLAAPLALAADRMPEMVRLLTDLVR